MKLHLLIFSLLALTSIYAAEQAAAQSNVTIDVGQVIKSVSSNPFGININYLMDGSYISATTTSNTALAIKGMNMKMLRYPGGEKSDNYYWSSAPYDKAKPSVILTGSCQFPSNDSRFVQADLTTSKSEVLDFDEFMTVAHTVGAEPMLVCAYDAAYYGGSIEAPYPCGPKPTLDQLITNAKEWVRYANKTKNYNIKYWCIGNESWNNCVYNGCVSADQYAIDIVKFATAMRSVDPTIKIIANGLGPVWWQKLVTDPAAARVIDYLGVSCYPVYNYSAGYDEYRNNDYDLRDDLKIAANAITNFASTADKARIKVIATEFNSMDWSGVWVDNNDVGHALVSAEILGQSLRTPEVESMVFWNTRWIDNLTKPFDIYDALNKNSGTNANGLMLSAMGNSILPQMVKTTDAGKVKTFAFYDNISSKLNVILINKDNVSTAANVSVTGFITTPSCVRWEYKGADMNDTQPTYSYKDSVSLGGYPYTISLPRNSITILKMAASNILLPLPLLSFTATLTESGSGELIWQTNTNDSNSSFGIERSTDNVTWTAIGKVAANGIVTNKSYLFNDTNPFGSSDKVYYRIVKTDASGQVFTSSIRALQKVIASSLSIKLLNNPVQETANFNINGIKYAALKINLVDSKGIIVRIFPAIASDGLVSIDLKTVPAGIYFVQFISSVAQRTIKIVKN
jgi:alpha-N-arabinofuranosidase